AAPAQGREDRDVRDRELQPRPGRGDHASGLSGRAPAVASSAIAGAPILMGSFRRDHAGRSCGSTHEEEGQMTIVFPRRILPSLLVGLLLAAGCAQAPTSSGPAPATASAQVPLDGGTARIRMLNGNFATLNPYLAQADGGGTVAGAIYDQLVALDANGKVVP